jgi:hypothetical protein
VSECVCVCVCVCVVYYVIASFIAHRIIYTHICIHVYIHTCMHICMYMYMGRYGTLIVAVVVLLFTFCLRLFANKVVMPAVFRLKVSVVAPVCSQCVYSL